MIWAKQLKGWDCHSLRWGGGEDRGGEGACEFDFESVNFEMPT